MSMFFLYAKERDVARLLARLEIPAGPKVPEGRAFGAVLQWGAAVNEPPAGVPVLNPTRCVLRALHRRTACELLELHGIKTQAHAAGGADGRDDGALVGRDERERTVAFAYEFIVPVFHLEALAVFAKKRPPALIVGRAARIEDGGRKEAEDKCDVRLEDFREVPPPLRGFHMRRAARQAVRAVYALGLDLALVRVAVTAAGQTLVTGADPTPRLDDRLAELYAEAVNRLARERRRDAGRMPPAVVLGADPEFILRRPDGKVAAASRFLERQGRVGCDAVVLPHHRVILPLAELRPEPAADPRRLVRHIRRTMRLAERMIGDPQLEWLAGSMPAKGLPLGGHIHFSGVRLSSRLLRALDNYLALPLLLIEGEACGKRRPRYGFLGDFRRKSHGGFEYRALPSWLSTPELALAVLALARTVAMHCDELKAEPLQHIDVQRSYYGGDKAKIAPIVRKLWPDLSRLPAYGEYRKELDAFFDRLQRLEAWNEQEDFRAHWKIGAEQIKAGAAESFVL